MTRPTTCEGCGKPIEQPRRGQRKWCSDRCRKTALYAGRCVDCGAPTNGYDGPGTAAERCSACFNVRLAAQKKIEARSRMDQAIYWRSQGLRNAEIAERMGVTRSAVADLLSRAKRLHGLNVPRPPYWSRAA
jgi:DNA-directed RNA polymerase specialized sigma24 family protein